MMTAGEAHNKKISTLKEWVNSYSDAMLSWAVYKTSDQKASEDLVQETFIAAFNSFDSFNQKSQPKTWLFSILNNKVTDYHRKNFRQQTYTESALRKEDKSSGITTLFDSYGKWTKEREPQTWDYESENLLDNEEFRTVFQGCLEKLPGNWFSAVQLKYLEEKDGRIICQELGITPSNFWQILHRAKLRLRECMETNWFNT